MRGGFTVDVAAGTMRTFLTNLDRVYPTLGDRPLNSITPADVAAVVAELHGRGLKRESIRKTLSTLAQVLDFAKVVPNPYATATCGYPRRVRGSAPPHGGAYVTAVLEEIPAQYRLPILGARRHRMRVGELEALRWRDVDQREGRWRVSRATTKTRRGDTFRSRRRSYRPF